MIRCLSWLANAFALHLLIAVGSDNRTKKKKNVLEALKPLVLQRL